MDYVTNNPNPLKRLDTIDVDELMATPYAPKNFIVAEMIPEGLTLLCGPSKIGKSWLVLQLCICVALGVRFMGFNTQPCDVLYLALEDTFARVKERVSRITEDCPTRLRFAVQAGALGDTLEEQLVLHKAQYPETKLVVIDTLQKVRGASAAKSNGSAYSKDYTDSELCKRALANALALRGRHKGLVFHSDRGSQYSSRAYKSMLAENGIESSMSESGCPYDNSCEELFFALLKSVFFATLKKEMTQLQDKSCNCGENMLQ